MATSKVLVLGSAGYIGGTFLHHLLQTYKAESVTALVRNEEQAAKLAPFGVRTVVGSLEDIPLLSAEAAAHDVVVNFAVPFGGGDASIQALVDSLEKRAGESATKPVLLQTSGTGGIMHGSDGNASHAEWKDSDHEKWESLPETAYFQSGNRIVSKAAERGVISAYIIASPTVYGQGLGQGNKLSLQLPAYVRYAKAHSRAAYIGAGENVWGNVHVEDLSELYLILLKNALEHPETTKAAAGSHGWSNLIYGGSGEHTWKPVVELVGDLLHARGDVSKAGAISIPDGTGEMFMFGTTSVMEPSVKAKEFGWAAKQPNLNDAIKLALGPVTKA